MSFESLINSYSYCFTTEADIPYLTSQLFKLAVGCLKNVIDVLRKSLFLNHRRFLHSIFLMMLVHNIQCS